VETLAHQIAEVDPNPEILELARRIAEAQIDLLRVRHARHQLLSQLLSDPYYDSRANVLKKMRFIGHVLLIGTLPNISFEGVDKLMRPTPAGPQKLATILSQESKRLLSLDRYKRRARCRGGTLLSELLTMPVPLRASK